MSKAQLGQTRPDAENTRVTPKVKAKRRKRLETFDADARGARPWQDVLADLKARRPLPPSPR